MKNLLTITLIIFATLTAYSQNRLYENPEFDRIAKDHKIIAVMPFKATVSLRPRQMREVTETQLAEMEVAEGQEIQTSMYSWFLTREQRGTLTVDVQDPTVTNARLRQANIDITNFENYTPSDLAELLEVDAIIMGTFETSQPMSEGASVVLGTLFGFFGNTNKAVINLTIYNAEDNAVLVNYHRALNGSLGSTSENLVNRLMRKTSRKIAYTK